MSKLKPNAPTVIISVPFRGEPVWYASGPSIDAAEDMYLGDIISGRATPAYRIVAQLKVDQHDCPDHLCSARVH